MEIAGNSFCIAFNEGQKVHDRLAFALKQEHSVMLSFLNVTALTTAFLKTAIGQLYGEFQEQQIRTLLKVQDIDVLVISGFINLYQENNLYKMENYETSKKI